MNEPQVIRAAAEAGATISSEVASRLINYAELMTKWNRSINLTAARSAEEVLRQHVVDCLALLPHVPDTTRRIVDVGSGAGLPGIVLAACLPAVEVTALEPVHKKHAFLATAARELGLERFDARPERLEAVGDERFDVAVSRATFALAEWLARGAELAPLVLGMEGARRAELPAGAQRYPYSLADRTRAVIVYRST